MNQKPSKGYKLGISLVVLCALVLLGSILASGVVSVLKGALITLGVGSLVFYYSLPLIVKRKNYLGAGPDKQLVNVNVVPYIIFALVCLSIAGYGWYANV